MNRIKEFSTKNRFVKWLSNSAHIAFISVSLLSGAKEYLYKLNSPEFVLKGIQYDTIFLGEGQYILEYEQFTEEENQKRELTLDYSSFAVAFTVEAKLARGDEFIGGYSILKNELASYDLCFRLDKSETRYTNGHILIGIPKDPVKISNLEDVLQKYSVQYAFPDGTRTLNIANMRKGNGMQVFYKLV